jgi:hypothetical protein
MLVKEKEVIKNSEGVEAAGGAAGGVGRLGDAGRGGAAEVRRTALDVLKDRREVDFLGFHPGD